MPTCAEPAPTSSLTSAPAPINSLPHPLFDSLAHLRTPAAQARPLSPAHTPAKWVRTPAQAHPLSATHANARELGIYLLSQTVRGRHRPESEAPKRCGSFGRTRTTGRAARPDQSRVFQKLQFEMGSFKSNLARVQAMKQTKKQTTNQPNKETSTQANTQTHKPPNTRPDKPGSREANKNSSKQRSGVSKHRYKASALERLQARV